MTASRLSGLSVAVGSGKGWDNEGWRAVVEVARTAERCGFHSVWLTDGHRGADGVRPNLALVAAAVSVSTTRIRLRVEMAEQSIFDPLRVAEDWAVVDNLSHARVDLLSTLGGDRAGAQLRSLRELWSGGHVPRTGPGEEEYSVRTYPSPQQVDATFWLADLGDAPALAVPAELNTGVFLAEELTLDQIAKRVTLLREQERTATAGPVRLAVAAGPAADPEDVREIHALGVEELVYGLDLEAAGDHVTEAVTAVARRRLGGGDPG